MNVTCNVPSLRVLVPNLPVVTPSPAMFLAVVVSGGLVVAQESAHWLFSSVSLAHV